MTLDDTAQQRITRRQFLRLGALAAAIGALAAGCSPSQTGETAADTVPTTTPPAAGTPTRVPPTIATPTAAAAQPTGQAPAPTPTPATRQSLGVACPAGLVNDPYPGRCKRYRDSNGNGYCDFSEPGS